MLVDENQKPQDLVVLLTELMYMLVQLVVLYWDQVVLLMILAIVMVEALYGVIVELEVYIQ
jgi:hypothetical protein